MSAFVKTVFISSLIGLCIALGCDNPARSQPTDPVGTWKGTVSDSTMTMVVNGDFTFSTILPKTYGTYNVTGTYAFKDGTISLVYASGLLNGLGVPPPNTPVNGIVSGTQMIIPIPYSQYGDSVTLKKQ
jgi:hypothetical protein